MKEIYDPSITDPSLEELKEFALWYNEKIGNYPLIVGGWAVYFYTKGELCTIITNCAQGIMTPLNLISLCGKQRASTGLSI